MQVSPDLLWLVMVRSVTFHRELAMQSLDQKIQPVAAWSRRLELRSQMEAARVNALANLPFKLAVAEGPIWLPDQGGHLGVEEVAQQVGAYVIGGEFV